MMATMTVYNVHTGEQEEREVANREHPSQLYIPVLHPGEKIVWVVGDIMPYVFKDQDIEVWPDA